MTHMYDSQKDLIFPNIEMLNLNVSLKMLKMKRPKVKNVHLTNMFKLKMFQVLNE